MKPLKGYLFLCWFIGLLLVIVACEKKEEETSTREVVRPVKMMAVTSTREAFKRSFPGKVRASKRVELAFQVSGPLLDNFINGAIIVSGRRGQCQREFG